MTPHDDNATRAIDFRLLDGEELHRSYPETFDIPPRTQRHVLEPGDLVKLLFEIVDPPDGAPGAERMWVKVAQIVGERYVGTLANHPVAISSVALDSPIEFEPHHVIDIDPRTEHCLVGGCERASSAFGVRAGLVGG